MTKIEQARHDLMRGELVRFVPRGQRLALLETLAQEDTDGVEDLVLKLAAQVAATPKTYGQGAVSDPIAHLHYFGGSYDAWIAEKDMGSDPDDPWPRQIQAFGWASFFGKGEAEAGYISIEELLGHELINIDLFWTPKPISQVLKES